MPTYVTYNGYSYRNIFCSTNVSTSKHSKELCSSQRVFINMVPVRMSNLQRELMHTILVYFAVPTCPPLIIYNGRIDYIGSTHHGRYRVGAVARFSCNSGYTRFGSSSRTCQSSEKWSGGWSFCFRDFSKLLKLEIMPI